MSQPNNSPNFEMVKPGDREQYARLVRELDQPKEAASDGSDRFHEMAKPGDRDQYDRLVKELDRPKEAASDGSGQSWPDKRGK